MTIAEPQNLPGVSRKDSATPKTDSIEHNSDTWNLDSHKIEDPLHQSFGSTQTTSFYHPSPHPYAQPPGWAASMMQHNGGGGLPGDQRYGLPSGMDYASAAAASMGHHPHAHHPSPSTHPGLASLDPHAHYGLQPAPHHPAGIHPAHVPGGNSINSKRNADSAGLDMMGQSVAGSSDEDDGSMDIKPSLSERGRGQPLKSPGSDSGSKKTRGRVKIKMEFIDNKLRRYTTFSKRKTGIMKKAYELSTLTGTQVMLLVASETGHVYTFATRKLQPMITSDAGKALIQTCLNSPDPPGSGVAQSNDQRMSATGFEETELTYNVADDVAAAAEQQQKEDDPEGIEEEEEEEECAQYPEEGASEDEANPEDIDDPESNLIVDEVEASEEDSVSITQVERVKRKQKRKKKVEFSGNPDEHENNSSDEEEELRVAAINNAIENSMVYQSTSSAAQGMIGVQPPTARVQHRKQRKQKPKQNENIVTIQPVPSKTLNIPNQVHLSQSTTIAGLPSTIVTTPTPNIVLPYVLPGGSQAIPNPVQLVSGSTLLPKQPTNVAYSISQNSLPSLTQTLLVGGRVIKQGGNTISIQPAGTPTILVPGPIMTTTPTTHVTTNLLVSDPSTSNVLPSTVPNIPSTSSASVSRATPKKRKRK